MERTYASRTLEADVKNAAARFPAVALTGLRQTGKTTMLRTLFPLHQTIHLGDPAHRAIAQRSADHLQREVAAGAIFDGIEHAPEIMPRLQTIIGQGGGEPGRFLLTASPCFPLADEARRWLPQQATVLSLTPLSFVEMGGHVTVDSPLDFFKMLWRGFFPLPALHGRTPGTYYEKYLDVFLEEDIRRQYQIHNVRHLLTFLQRMAARTGAALRVGDVSRECGLSSSTANKWLTLLTAAGLVYSLRPTPLGGNGEAARTIKVFFGDTGLLASLLHYPDAATLLAGPAASAFFENFVVMEIIKRCGGDPARIGLSYVPTAGTPGAQLVALSVAGTWRIVAVHAATQVSADYLADLDKQRRRLPPAEWFVVSATHESGSWHGMRLLSWRGVAEVLAPAAADGCIAGEKGL